MTEIMIPVDGKDTRMQLKQIQIDKLELDEMNPRISFFRDNQVTESLSNEQIVFALTNKKPEAFRKLRDAIHNNKGVYNPIWVEPFKNDRYRVIEGNTRLVAYRCLRELEPNEERWKNIYCFVFPNEIKDSQKNFIRLQAHLRGATDWDAYEKAKYLYTLWDKDGWSISRLEKQTKLSEKEIKANIEAYKLMEEQYLSKYGDDPNEVSKFSYFVEYVKDKKLQKLMEQNALGIKDFCNWVVDREKIPTGQDVRRLRDLLGNDVTKKAFIKDGYNAAIQILALKKPHIVSTFYRNIESVVDGLKNISTHELDEIIEDENGEKENLIKQLAEWSNKVIKLIEKEKNGIKKT